MVEFVKDLQRGASEKTIGTYTTKGFKHSGVSGSRSVDRLNENGGKGITPTVMKENPSPLQKIAKNTVVTKAAGSGMEMDSGKVKKRGVKGSAGNVGSSNVNHK